MKFRQIARSSALVLMIATFATLTLHAQGGCADSPENPTAILALVGGAGVVLSRAINRFRGR